MNVVFYHSSANQCYFLCALSSTTQPFNHPFAHTLCFSPLLLGDPALARPSVGRALYFSCWTALGFEGLFSTTYLVSL